MLVSAQWRSSIPTATILVGAEVSFDELEDSVRTGCRGRGHRRFPRRAGRARGSGGSEQRRDPCGDVVVAEAGQVDAVDGGEAGELGEAASLCRVGADFGRAVGADEHDGDVEEVAGEVVEEVPSVGVGPMEVLDPRCDDTVGAEVADELEDRCEETAGAALVAGSLVGVEPVSEGDVAGRPV